MRVLVGITGGVAAYKAAEIIRELTESGHQVKAVPTKNALRFIGAATLESLTHNKVFSELYDDVQDVRHIELAKWAELVIVAPATASFIARTAMGLADDLLGNLILATLAPIVIAPAMHTEMWQNKATVTNVQLLRDRGVLVIDPAVGRLTGNDTGVGRLPEPQYIVKSALSKVVPQDLEGKRVLVVAGGTRENIDPVRFIGNRSSGKQGIAIVEEAISRGANVSLIAANFFYYSPEVATTQITSTQDLISALANMGSGFDYVVMPAAVADYRVESPSVTKIKKIPGNTSITMSFIENPDVIAGLASSVHAANSNAKVVGFAAETTDLGNLESLAFAKLSKKGLDLVVANDVSENKGFDLDANSVLLVSARGVVPMTGSKRDIAKAIFDNISL